MADAHTTRALVRGGAKFALTPAVPHSAPAHGLSYWYFPTVLPNRYNTAMPPFSSSPLLAHNTLLLLSGASDRAATVGFRCAWGRG